MKVQIIGAIALLALGGCGTMTVDSRILTSSEAVNAWAEVRTVRDQMDLMDDINDRYELWGVNRSDESVCIGHRPSGSYWSTYEVPARTEMKLSGWGNNFPAGETAIGTVRTTPCNSSRYTN